MVEADLWWFEEKQAEEGEKEEETAERGYSVLCRHRLRSNTG